MEVQVQAEIDSEILIENVRKYSDLFDKKHKFYKNYKYKDMLWAKISKDMNVNDPRELKKKWTYIRDKFQKELKKFNQPSGSGNGSGNSVGSTWCLFDNLSFLKDYVRCTVTNGNYSRSSTPLPVVHYNDENIDDDTPVYEIIDYSGDDPSIVSCNSNSAETRNTPSSSKRKGDDDDLTKVIALIKKKCESDLQQQLQPKDDHIDRFCALIKSYISEFPQQGQDEAILYITNYVINKNKDFTN